MRTRSLLRLYSAIRVAGRELGCGQVAALGVEAAEVAADVGVLERLRRRRDARAGRWVVLATERDDVPGQARRQAVTYGTPGRAAWLARSLARRLAGRLAGAAPGAGAWCGRGRAPFHKVLAPIWLVDLLEHRVVRRVPARGARPGRGLRLQLRPWLRAGAIQTLGRGLGRYGRCGAQPAHLVSPGALAREVCGEPLAWRAGALVPAYDHATRPRERVMVHGAHTQ